MEERKRKLDSWDTLVKETTNSLPTLILKEMDQSCPWVPREATLEQVLWTSSVHPVP